MPVRPAAATALDEWFAPRVGPRRPGAGDRWRRRDDAEAVFLNQRGGRLTPPGGVGRGPAVRRAGRPRATTCRRTCCATRAPRTCSTTAPTSASCRRCSATPRSRPPRCTPRSARSGCGRSTGPPTRGPAPSVSCDSAHLARRVRRVAVAARRRRPTTRRGPSGWLVAGRGRPVAADEQPPTGATRSRWPGASSAAGRDADRAEIAGALLHDVGKIECGPGHVRTGGGHGRRPARTRFRRTTTTRRSVPGWPPRPDPIRSPSS